MKPLSADYCDDCSASWPPLYAVNPYSASFGRLGHALPTCALLMTSQVEQVTWWNYSFLLASCYDRKKQQWRVPALLRTLHVSLSNVVIVYSFCRVLQSSRLIFLAALLVRQSACLSNPFQYRIHSWAPAYFRHVEFRIPSCDLAYLKLASASSLLRPDLASMIQSYRLTIHERRYCELAKP